MLTAYLGEDRLLQHLLPSPKFSLSLVKHEGTAQPGAETEQAGVLLSAYAHALWLPSGRVLRPRVSLQEGSTDWSGYSSHTHHH